MNARERESEIALSDDGRVSIRANPSADSAHDLLVDSFGPDCRRTTTRIQEEGRPKAFWSTPRTPLFPSAWGSIYVVEIHQDPSWDGEPGFFVLAEFMANGRTQAVRVVPVGLEGAIGYVPLSRRNGIVMLGCEPHIMDLETGSKIPLAAASGAEHGGLCIDYWPAELPPAGVQRWLEHARAE